MHQRQFLEFVGSVATGAIARHSDDHTTQLLGAAAAADSSHGFLEFNWEECKTHQAMVCASMLYFAGVFCSAAGIGGGGIYVVLLMVVGQLTPYNAVPLSKAIVFPGAVATLWVNIRRANAPDAESSRSVINYTACKFVVPAALAGTFVGVLINAMVPGTVILVILALSLLAMTASTTRIAWTQWVEQTEDTTSEPTTTEGAGSNVEDGHGELRPLVPKRGSQQGSDCSTVLDESVLGTLNLGDAALMGSLLLIVILSGVVHFYVYACTKDPSASDGWQAQCRQTLIDKVVYPERQSPKVAASIELISIALPLVVCMSAAGYWYVSRPKSPAGSWSMQVVLIYQSVSFVTGVLAGLVGVGGGLFFSPFFLIMGMDPAVAVGTSSTCVLFTSSSTATQYILTNRVDLALAVFYGAVTCFASWTGTTVVHLLQDRMAGKTWFITAIVASSVGVSAVLVCGKMAGAK
eukprot:TRINITY_DN44689_c0_g1_i1.p1 TRINITY_DN44689_c0_g1~~TRINITY_DN44689_c0_g1_i1.p1  ORF type:complete len:464 (-),score=78.88 TRINITY_DN44689_c0_g1_i1:87-1478(-)